MSNMLLVVGLYRLGINSTDMARRLNLVVNTEPGICGRKEEIWPVSDISLIKVNSKYLSRSGMLVIP